MKRTILLVLASTLSAQQPPVAMPAWLVPYPGAKTESQNTSATLIDAAYSTAAKPEAVLAHYRKLFEAATLAFAPSSDGVGTAVRAAAPECDLLVRIHTEDDQTRARVTCAAKVQDAPASPPSVLPVRPPTLPRAPYRDAKTEQVLADAEARHKAGIKKMSVYDQPVNPKDKK